MREVCATATLVIAGLSLVTAYAGWWCALKDLGKSSTQTVGGASILIWTSVGVLGSWTACALALVAAAIFGGGPIAHFTLVAAASQSVLTMAVALTTVRMRVQEETTVVFISAFFLFIAFTIWK